MKKPSIVTLLVLTTWMGNAEAQTPTLKNGDFETKPSKKDEIPGFTLAIGAQNGATTPASEVTLDAKVRHGGKTSLKIAGTDTTRGWNCVTQALPVRPGGTYKLTGFFKAENVKAGFVKGTKIAHFQNCHV